MINCKLVLLSLAALISLVSAAAAGDWLGNELEISDIHHTADYLSKTGSASKNDTNVDETDGGIAALPTAKADREVYDIGGTGTAAQPPLAETANAAEPSDYSGRWSFAMAEETTRSIDLALYQRGDLVFGRGVMGTSDSSAAGAASSEDRGIGSMVDWLNQPPAGLESASQAAASGTVVGSDLKLDLVSLDSIALYRFDLSLTGDLVSGSYSAYGSDGSAWSGTVTGTRKS
ncbi:hypothetical protein [Methanocrinis sp.]|uniref:hypothetical protein n=1 Tax=Methanocrinis sp. TaxID=3101522 RepID=UPI003D114DAD